MLCAVSGVLLLRLLPLVVLIMVSGRGWAMTGALTPVKRAPQRHQRRHDIGLADSRFHCNLLWLERSNTSCGRNVCSQRCAALLPLERRTERRILVSPREEGKLAPLAAPVVGEILCVASAAASG